LMLAFPGTAHNSTGGCFAAIARQLSVWPRNSVWIIGEPPLAVIAGLARTAAG
jgi:hypothetical protein